MEYDSDRGTQASDSYSRHYGHEHNGSSLDRQLQIERLLGGRKGMTTFMKTIERFSFLHPLFFAAFPVLSFLAENIQQIPASQAIRSLVLALLGAIALLLLSRALFKDWHKAAALTTLALILFFSYGHVYAMLKTTRVAGVLVGRHRYLLPLSLAVLMLAAWILGRRVRQAATLSRGLLMVSVLLLVYPSYTVVAFGLQSLTERGSAGAVQATAGDDLQLEAGMKPDVYYVILDAYLRSDILREDYGYDNSDFMRFLRERGFFIADKATSNYGFTALSLTSSLNMQHLVEEFGGKSAADYPGAIRDRIAHSEVRRLLESFGYTTVAISSGWVPTEIPDANIYLKPQISELDRHREAGRINAFESMFIRTTVGLALIDLSAGGENPLLKNLEAPFMAHHYFVLAQLELLKQAVDVSGPKFVFAHIISPHHPYVFGPNGELVTSQDAFTWADGIGPRDSVDREMALYRDQAIYITQRAEEIIETIIQESELPPVIILQADHGPGIRMNWGSPTETALIDRMSILNAYLLPEECGELLYPSISPVNSFQVLFNCFFIQSIPTKEDTSFFSPHSDPYDFTEVTDVVR